MLHRTVTVVGRAFSGPTRRIQKREVHTSNKKLQAYTRGGFSNGSGYTPRGGGTGSTGFRPRSTPAPQQYQQHEVEDIGSERNEDARVVNDSEDYGDDSTVSQNQHSGYSDSRMGDSRYNRPKGPPAPLLALYRPNRDAAKGSAAQFSFASNRKASYLSMAKQQGDKTAPGSSERQFNWDNKLVFKLDVPDMSKILNMLEGKVDNVDILHLSEGQQQQRYTTLKMKPSQSGKGFYLSLLRAEGEQKQMISILVDETDSRTLQIYLDESIRRSLGFSF